MKDYEQFAAGYGIRESIVLANLSNATSDKVQFSITSEQQLAMFNARRLQASTPLIALYPEEGSYWMDYSMCLSDADWITPAHRAAAKMLVDFLSTEIAQIEVMRRGFRPSRLSLPPVPPLTKKYGIDVSKGQRARLPVDGQGVEFLLERLSDIMRPSAVLYVLDASGSMEGAPLRVGKDLYRTLLASSHWRDVKGLISFSTKPEVLVDFTADSNKIIPVLDRVRASGGSAVYDAIRRAVDLMVHSPIESHRKTIVVYTDGDDKNSETSLRSLLAYSEDMFKVHNIDLIIIGVGHDTDFSDLEQVASVANGIFRRGGLDDMKQIFEEVQISL
ncbi:MAG: VWA domain-containing protein [Bdellovibrionales bacterium]|nr:VWA domain-containing protein [Bdellovibrionales bacterium]